MIEIKLQFTIELPYNRTWYPPLKEIVINGPFKNELGNYIWTFSVSKLDFVLSVINEQVIVDDYELNKLLKHKNSKISGVGIVPYKGEGKYVTHKVPTGYELIWYQKNSHGKGIEIKKGEVTIELLTSVFNSLCTFPKSRFIKSSTVAKRVCLDLNIIRFNRESGTFDWKKFFGTRYDYFRFFYIPIKVLCVLGFVEYHKSGKVKRLKDSLEFQTVICNDI